MTDGHRHWLQINRAPVLTLWASVVAERLGYDCDEALSLGKAVAGLNAYAKGKSLGLFQPSRKKVAASRTQSKTGHTLQIDLLGRAVTIRHENDGIRAVKGGSTITPDGVRQYLGNKFGDALADTRSAMQELARSRSPTRLASDAYPLYEAFRPEIPSGKKGWGAAGRLSLDKIRSLAQGS